MKNAKSERKRSISDSFGKENILLFVFSVLTAFFVLMTADPVPIVFEPLVMTSVTV